MADNDFALGLIVGDRPLEFAKTPGVPLQNKRSGYGWWVTAQGCVLLGWLIVEMAMLRLVVWPHYLH